MLPPGIAITGFEPEPVQSAGDNPIGIEASHLFHDLHGIDSRPVIMFSRKRRSANGKPHDLCEHACPSEVRDHARFRRAEGRERS